MGAITEEQETYSNKDRACSSDNRGFAQTQNQLISDILDISRIGAGKIALDTQEVELMDVVAKAIKMVRLSAERKSIHISESLGTEPIFVTGDPVRIKQILWNLLSNSIKFTPSGGRIDISFEVIHDNSEHKVRICVRDTGKGLSSTFLPHVFDLFSQADSTSTRVHGGLGLGLALAQQLTKLHNGKIEAQSEGEGKGATFIVTLPKNVAPQLSNILHVSQDAGGSSPFQMSLSGLHILLVDDEKSTLDSIKEILSLFGAQVKTASSVSEAIVEFEGSVP